MSFRINLQCLDNVEKPGKELHEALHLLTTRALENTCPALAQLFSIPILVTLADLNGKPL